MASWLVWLTVAGSQAAVVPAPLLLVDGSRAAARLVSVSDGKATLETDGQPTTRPWTDVVRWGRPVDARDHSTVATLADGSRIVGEPTALDATALTIVSPLFGSLKVPRAALRSVYLDVRAGNGTPVDEFATPDARLAFDRLKLANGDELAGTLSAWTEDSVTITVAARNVTLQPEAVVSATWAAARGALPPRRPRYVLGFDEGSRLSAESFTVEGGTLRAWLLAGPVVTAKADRLRLVQPFSGRVTYLSELQPAGYKHVPYLSLSWPYRVDRNVTAGPLRAGGQSYLMGLGMHSASRLTYALDKPYRRFDAELAIDDSTRGRGSVVFRVYVDNGSGPWESRYASATIRGGDSPVPISVDVAGARRLALVVDYADRGDELDHANWLEARLIAGE